MNKGRYYMTEADSERMRRKYRNQPRGEDHPNAKLTEHDVALIKALGGHISHREIARKFECSRSMVSRILAGDNWGHVPPADG